MENLHVFAYAIAVIGTLGLSVALFLSNRRYRGAIDDALATIQEPRPLTLPEQMRSYDEEYLNTFRDTAKALPTKYGKTALQLYVRPTLLWIDVGFAFAFSCFIALLWIGVQMLLPQLQYLALFCGGMAVGYGVVDVAEDLWLARLFSQISPITPKQAKVACRLTQSKFALIASSLAGGALFLLLRIAFPNRTTQK